MPMIFGSSSVDLSSLQNNVALGAFRLAVVGGLAGQYCFDDGFVDEFEDETGMDLGASTNEAYDGTNDHYGGVNIGALSDLCTQAQAISGGDWAGHGKELAFNDADVLDWNSSQSAGGVSGVAYIGQNFGANKMINCIRFKNGPNANEHISSAKVEYSDNGAAWTTLETITLPNDLVWHKFNLTNTTQSHQYWRLLANAEPAVGPWGVYEIEMSESQTGTGTFTLISNAVDADADDPIKARLILFCDFNGESPTINTDILGYVSLDDGASFDAVTLEDAGLYDVDCHILSGDADLTAGSDKHMVIKVVVDNGKDVYFKGWACLWEW